MGPATSWQQPRCPLTRTRAVIWQSVYTGRVIATRDFLAIFGRLFDCVPLSILTSNLHHRTLQKKSLGLTRSEIMIFESKNECMGDSSCPSDIYRETDIQYYQVEHGDQPLGMWPEGVLLFQQSQCSSITIFNFSSLPQHSNLMYYELSNLHSRHIKRQLRILQSNTVRTELRVKLTELPWWRHVREVAVHSSLSCWVVGQPQTLADGGLGWAEEGSENIYTSTHKSYVQPGAVKLVLWRQWMHEIQVHPVTPENQFHCTRLYTRRCTPT